MVLKKMKERLQLKDLEIESVQEDKQVEEEILERNIKLRFVDILRKEELSK